MLISALRYLAYSTTLVMFSLTLTACGSSSSGDGPGNGNGVVDTTPDAFSFPALEDQEPGAEVTSEAVPITGIDGPAEATIENGYYAIDATGSDDDEFVSGNGQIDKDQTLTLQTTAPDRPDETKEVTVTVGGVTGRFSVSTMKDTEPPEAAFVFPTPMTATEADTVIVRGTATDALSTVTRVTLNVSNEGGTTDLDLESDDDFATWQKQVSLAEGENIITLSAEDEFGNELADGDSVTVVRQDFELSFPDDEVPIGNPQKLVYDEARERVLFGGITGTLIYAVDINTGKRSALFTQAMAPELSTIQAARGLELVPESDELLVLFSLLKSEGPGVLRIDLDTEEFEVVLTRDSQPDDQPNFTTPTSIRVDPDNPDRAIALNGSGRRVLSLDLITGVRTLITNNDEEFSGPLMRTPNDLLIDATNNRVLVTDNDTTDEVLYWVDLETGDRAVLLSEGVPEGTPRFNMSAIVTDDIGERVFGLEGRNRELWSVNTTTGEHEVLSGPELPHGYNELYLIRGAALSANKEYFIGVDSSFNGVFVVDLQTGERVILSKN